MRKPNFMMFMLSGAMCLAAGNCTPPATHTDSSTPSSPAVVDDVTPPAVTDETTPPAVTEPTPLPPGSYLVSVSGSDTTGNGSASRPWRTIGYSLTHMDYTAGTPVLNIAAGTYDESVTISKSVTLTGPSSSTVIIHNSDAANTGHVITIEPAAAAPAITVSMSGIRVDGLAGKNPGVHVAQTTLTMNDVDVHEAGGYSIVIADHNPGFTITHCTIGSIGFIFSDIGIDIGSGSSGTISHCTMGDRIDHIINISVGCRVTISDCQLTGSPIYWADGVRVQGASNVTVANTTIIRAAGAEPASAGPLHNPPYAGVEIATASNGSAAVSVTNCTISGFDIGIGLNMMWNSASVQQCTVGGNITADVQTIWHGSSASMYPVIDLGGGSLGSTGGNNFGSGSETAVQLGGPYNVSAMNNQWGVSGPSIESRITDQLDDALLGRVVH